MMWCMDLQEVARQAGEVRLVRFLWCGNDGTIRAKASGRHGLEGRLERGIGVTRAMQAMNGLDSCSRRGPRAGRRVPPDAGPRDFPRAALRARRRRAADRSPRAGRGAGGRLPARVPQADAEPARRARAGAAGGVRERVLARHARRGPLRAGGHRAVLLHDRDDRVAGLRGRARDGARRPAIPVEQYYAELGHGQQEISTAHAPAVQAADEQLLVRETIRGVASAQELVASLAPKPWIKNAGNGCHLHFSLWDGRAQPFYEGGGFSALGRAFVAGVVEHLPGLCGLTAPSFNSYQRIAPGTWSGAYECWGFDNREAPVRVPSVFRGAEEESTNVELKACDATCNPYLAIGGVIAAGLDGIERELEPPEPVDVDPATLGVPRACPTTQARRSTRSPPTTVLAGRAGRRARRVLPRRPPLRVGGLLRGRRGIRAAGTFREVLNEIALVDHHAHGILREPPATLDEFRGLFSESDDPRQWPHVATSVTYRRAVAALAEHFESEPTEDAVFAFRLSLDPLAYAASLLRATGTETLLIDDGFPPPELSVNWRELGEVAGCARGRSCASRRQRRRVAAPARDGFVALKTIAAYRGGLVDLDPRGARGAGGERGDRPAARPGPLRLRRRRPVAAAVAPGLAEAGDRALRHDPVRAPALLPVHPRGGLARARVPERVVRPLADDPARGAPGRGAVRGAGARAVLEAVVRLGCGADPELYLLGALWWRDALAVVLPDLLGDGARRGAGDPARERLGAVFVVNG